MAITRQQARIYMDERNNEQSQKVAAAKAGISERTARRVEQEGQKRRPPRQWRTRTDPFEGVWDEIAARLGGAPDLQALTLLEWLQERYPGKYPDKLLRTLQRRVKAWRLEHGPDKEVMFPQRHAPGELGLSDFTLLKQTTITIAGEPLVHRLYHFRLAYSGWCHARVVLGGESYTALAEGLSEALEHLGGVPAEHRTDSLSAAYRNLDAAAQSDITARYQALCTHYGLQASRNNPGRGHENGAIESPHGHLKRRLRERLKLRGNHDFADLTAYRCFIDEVVVGINRRNAKAIAAEHPSLRPLPCRRGQDYTEAVVRVTSSSTFAYAKVLYSVPARLIGERLRLRAYDDRLVLFHGGRELLTLQRLHSGPGESRRRNIDYRHVIDWLARKPRALARLAFRDDLLPDDHWRAIYQRLRDTESLEAACKRVVGALKLAAAEDRAAAIGQDWLAALERGESPSLTELQARYGPPAGQTAVPSVRGLQHTLADYDQLLQVGVSRG